MTFCSIKTNLSDFSGGQTVCVNDPKQTFPLPGRNETTCRGLEISCAVCAQFVVMWSKQTQTQSAPFKVRMR